MPRRLLPLLLAALLTAAGCAAPADEVVLRAAVARPPDLLDLDSLLPAETVFRWQLSRDPERFAWSARHDSRLERRKDQVVMASDSGVATIERSADLVAAEVAFVEVKLAGLRGGRVILGWSGEETADAFLTQPVRHPYHRFFKTYRFAVGSDPRWRGTIDRIRLRIEGSSPDGYALRYVLGGRRQFDGSRWRQAVDRPWKVSHQGEARDGWLTPVDSPRRLAMGKVPRGARLHLGHALLGSRPEATRLIVERLHDDGSREPLLEVDRQPGPWHDETIDLAAIAGEDLVLELAATSPRSPADPTVSLAAWSRPQVIAPRPGRDRPNVLLISLDTLRADRLSLYGHHRQTSPLLDRWAAGAAVFEQALAASPWTLPSHVSMFTGIDAQRHGVNYNNDRMGDVATLAGALQDLGYATEAITGGGFLRPDYGLARGFDRFRFWPSRQRQENELTRNVDHALERLAELAEGRFFLLFHTYEIHSPFTPRQPWFETYSGGAKLAGKLVTRQHKSAADQGFKTRYGFALETRAAPGEAPQDRPLTAAEKDLPGDLYDSAIAYTDVQIGRLLAGLEELALDRDTVIVITSDHGELLGEDGLASHAYLRPENLRVPLLISTPEGLGAGRRIERPVGSVDLLPTLLELVGAEPLAGLDGTSLLPLMAGESDGPRSTWSYAGGSNGGLQADLGRRGVFTFDDTAWRPHAEIGHPGGGSAADPREIEALRRWASQRLSENPRGLFLRFHNPSAETVQGTLEGQRFVPTGLKALDLPCACVTWLDQQRIAFEVPPGSSYTLVFRRRLLTDFLGLAIDDGERFRFAVAELGERTVLAQRHGTWQIADHEEESLPSIVLWHDEGATAEAARTDDRELREQLKALGYLD
ncbi:MAG: sulfatase [Acidobacteriota bacterium]